MKEKPCNNLTGNGPSEKGVASQANSNVVMCSYRFKINYDIVYLNSEHRNNIAYI